jgi:uncharacterized protein YdbL (DUF1318 family)
MSQGAIPIEEYLKEQRKAGAAESERLATEKEAREKWAADHPEPVKPPVEELRIEHARLTAVVADAEGEAERAAKNLADAESSVADLTRKIVASDGGAETEKLAMARSVQSARCEAFQARLSDRMAVLGAAREAAKESARALDVADLAAGLAELASSDVSLDEKIRGAAGELAAAYLGHAEIHARVARLHARVQVARGTRPDDIRGVGLRGVEDLGESFGGHLQAAIASASGR